MNVGKVDTRSLFFGFIISSLGVLSLIVYDGVILPITILTTGLIVSLSGFEDLSLPLLSKPSTTIGVVCLGVDVLVFFTRPDLAAAVVALGLVGSTLIALGQIRNREVRRTIGVVAGAAVTVFGGFGFVSPRYPDSLSLVVAVLGVLLAIVSIFGNQN